jgi:hypothetical protein
VVEDKGAARRENLLVEPNRVRRVENIREGMRETDSAHETTPVMKGPGDSASFPKLGVSTLADPKLLRGSTFQAPRPQTRPSGPTGPKRHGDERLCAQRALSNLDSAPGLRTSKFPTPSTDSLDTGRKTGDRSGADVVKP